MKTSKIETIFYRDIRIRIVSKSGEIYYDYKYKSGIIFINHLKTY